MIQMPMRQNNRVDLGHVGRNPLVEQVLIVSPPLVHATIEQQTHALCFDQMTGARNRPIRTAELDSHGQETKG